MCFTDHVLARSAFLVAVLSLLVACSDGRETPVGDAGSDAGPDAGDSCAIDPSALPPVACPDGCFDVIGRVALGCAPLGDDGELMVVACSHTVAGPQVLSCASKPTDGGVLVATVTWPADPNVADGWMVCEPRSCEADDAGTAPCEGDVPICNE